MALSNYGVVKGDFDHFTRDPINNFGKYLHGHIFVRVPDGNKGTKLFDCACDVNTPNGWIDYFHVPSLDATKFLVVPNLPDGHHFLPTAHDPNAPTGGALDFVRNPQRGADTAPGHARRSLQPGRPARAIPASRPDLAGWSRHRAP
jgi:hypothetical protein